MARAQKRIGKELSRFDGDAGESGLTLEAVSETEWKVSFVMGAETVFSGENYSLRIVFTNEYPMESPIVVFEQPSPMHEHVYSNGHICLNILDDDWSPALTVCSVCLSIQSMLASAQAKLRPPDDKQYSARNVSNPKMTSWFFHDDSV